MTPKRKVEPTAVRKWRDFPRSLPAPGMRCEVNVGSGAIGCYAVWNGQEWFRDNGTPLVNRITQWRPA